MKERKKILLEPVSSRSEKRFTKMKRGSIIYRNMGIVEIIFSSIKRIFASEYVYSVKLKYIIQEMMLKASPYNKMMSV